MEKFGLDGFFQLLKGMELNANSTSLETIISMLKLSDWDPDVFYKFKNILREKSPFSEESLISDIIKGL